MRKKMSAIEKYNRLIDFKNAENEEFESLENADIYENEYDENLEELEELEDLENYRNYGSLRHMQPQRIKSSRNQIYQIPSQMQYNRFGQPLVKTATPQLMRTGTTPKPSSVVVQFDLKIERTSANINSSMPIILFDTISVFSGFKELIKPQNGLSLQVYFDNDANLIFSYLDGTGKNDRIKVSCLQVPYRDLIEGLLTSEFDIFKMRIITPPTTYQNYLSQPLGTVRRTMFGKISDIDTIPFISQKSPTDYAPNIIDIDLNLHIQNDKGITYQMPAENNAVTFSFFVNNLIKK